MATSYSQPTRKLHVEDDVVEKYPLLGAFMRARLHQDFALENPHAPDAVSVGLANTPPELREGIEREWARWMEEQGALPLHELREILVDLGCAWYPRRKRDVLTLFPSARINPKSNPDRHRAR